MMESRAVRQFIDSLSLCANIFRTEFNIFSNKEVRKKTEKGEKLNITLIDNGVIIEKVTRDTIPIAKIQEGIDINIFSESEIQNLVKGKVVIFNE